MEFSYRNVNLAFAGLVSGIQDGTIYTVKASSRNGPVLHIPEPVTITYTHPRERVLFNVARDCNPFFHLFESLWMLSGSNKVAPVEYYVSNMRNYSDDGETLNGAYGHRWRHAAETETVDQLSILIEHLRHAPDSRRAILQMWNVEDDLLKIGWPSDTTSRDVCCNLSVCFSLRNEVVKARQEGNAAIGHYPTQYLDMTVFNRSNDLIWGTLGANVVHFSMLQEYMANSLGAQVGLYHQVSNNQHVYLNNFKPDEWLSSAVGEHFAQDKAGVYPPLGPNLVLNREQFDIEVEWWVEGSGFEGVEYSEPFLRDVAEPMCQAFIAHKVRDYPAALKHLNQVKATDWFLAGLRWLTDRRNRYEARQLTGGV